MPKNLQNRHTYRRIVTPFFGQTMYLCNQNSITNIAYGRTDPFHRRDTPLAYHHLPRSLRCDVVVVPRAPGASPAWQIILRNKPNINNQVNPNDETVQIIKHDAGGHAARHFGDARRLRKIYYR